MSGRNKKLTVDYFPHFCKHGKMMFILESLYGNDGYAFFYKLYEILGDEPNHHFRAGNSEAWEYLLAYTRTSAPTAENILNKLASLGVIEQDLWEGERSIWSQALVDSLSEVYRKRVITAPEKPRLGEYQRRKCDGEGISPDINRQSKVEYSKEKKRKEKPFVDSSESTAHYSDDFLKFYSIYPNKTGSKKNAYEVWNKLNGKRPDLDVILAAIENQKKWRERATGFVREWKDADRWLKGYMWEATESITTAAPTTVKDLTDRARICFIKCAGTCGARWDIYKDDPDKYCHHCQKFEKSREAAHG